MDAIQSGILLAKLRRLREWNQQRRRIAARYRELLAKCDNIGLPYEPQYARSNCHLFVIRVPDRNILLDCLGQAGIGVAVHYPAPIHCQAAFQQLGYRSGDFPVAERLAAEVLSLPMYPQLEDVQQWHVVEELRDLLAAHKRLAAMHTQLHRHPLLSSDQLHDAPS
jgi:dTDP-4-amino-4,6-dideoxygalactose transaminase